MKVLFVDNFRGFSNTYIPITDVNFLVGENSTGKTSILGLLKLISSPPFWFDNEFNSPDVKFGHFKDIVSISAKDRSYFSVGFIQTVQEDKNASERIQAFLTTYVEKEGMPRPYLFIHLYGDNELRVRITPNQSRFKQERISKYTNLQHFITERFSEWVLAHKADTSDYQSLPSELRNLARAPLLFVSSVIERLLEKDSRRPKSFSARIPAVSPDIAWLAPIRTKPRRTYDEYKLEFSPEGTHTPYLIKKILEKKSAAKEFRKFLERVGRDSGLFETIQTRQYGRGGTAPFELDVVINDKALSVSNVGYGVSQALPVIVEVFARPQKTWFAIQQPEVHLHPKAQAVLGDIFFELAVKEQKRFIVETHSDYTIDRFRLNFKREGLQIKPQAQVLYFERSKDGNTVYQLEIDQNGELPTDQPKGYREFFVKEEMRLLGL